MAVARVEGAIAVEVGKQEVRKGEAGRVVAVGETVEACSVAARCSC